MKRLWLFALVGVFFSLVALTSCRKKESKEQRAETDIQQKFAAFAASHNATVPDQRLTIMEYSIQAENALLTADKHPVALRAYLNDIVRRNGRVFLEFSAPVEDLYLTLEATPETVQQILKEDPSRSFNEYAVVAEIESVGKPTFQVAAEETGDGPDVHLQSSSEFHAKGRCVAVLDLSVR